MTDPKKLAEGIARLVGSVANIPNEARLSGQILPLLERAREEWVREAAALICSACAEGKPVELTEDGYRHRTPNDRAIFPRNYAYVCDAARIHEAVWRAAVAQEEVKRESGIPFAPKGSITTPPLADAGSYRAAESQERKRDRER